MVPYQDEHVGVAQRAQTRGLRDLWRLVHDAEVERALLEQGVAHTQTRGRHDRLKKERGKTRTVAEHDTMRRRTAALGETIGYW